MNWWEEFQSKFKVSLARALSRWWVQTFVGLLPVAIIGLIVAMTTSTQVKIAALTMAGLGTLALWAVAIAILRDSGPNETEVHGLLRPANRPMPPNPCGEIPETALAIFLGRCAAYSSASPHTVISIRGDNVLSFRRVNDGIAVSARIFSSDGRIVAEIRDNEFFINPNNFFRRERPDDHSLTVFDQENNRVLDVFYLNSRAIRFSGIINHPAHRVVISDEEGLFRNTICF